MYDDDYDIFSESNSFADTDNTSKGEVSTSAYLRPEDVPFIPHSVQPFDFHSLIPQGFEEEVNYYLDTDESIVIRFLRPESELYNEVRLPKALYNSVGEGTIVPYFLFEKSSISKQPLDYLGADNDLVLTMGQMIYLIISHRLTFYKGYTNQFPYLLNADFKALKDYVEYEPAIAYNSQQKSNNTYVILPASSHMKVFPYGNFLVGDCRPTEEEWGAFLSDVSHYVLPSSDTAMQKRSKLVLSIQSIYRSVGYSHNSEKGEFYCIFEPKQNLSARLKTHLFGEAKRLLKSDLSVYQQDCIVKRHEDGTPYLAPKDETLKEAIVLFSPMDFDSKRFVAGEAEVSANIADTMVVNVDSVNVSFTGKDHTRVKHEIGKHVIVKSKRVLLGYDKELEPVYLYGAKSYKVLSISQSSTAGLSKVKFECVQKAGNARIISNTGLKFVSKVMTDMGTVYMPKPTGTATKPKFAPTVARYLKEADEDVMSKYKKIKTSEFDGMASYSPDVIVGMNAVKANSKEQCNSIALAQAAFAVKYGYYTPTKKFGFDNLLNTLDEDEINAARLSLPEFVYVNRFGQRERVFVGLAYLNYTELGSVYTTFKPQSFAHMSGKNINVNSPALNKHIFENYLDKDMIEIVEEFYKILNDKRARYRAKERLPRYDVAALRKKDKDGKPMFDHDTDLILVPTALKNYSSSKLLDENWNKGFYIDLSKYKNGMLIRIPCAKTLKRFVGTLEDGSYSFHSIIVNVCKMLTKIIGVNAYNTNMSLGTLYDNTRRLGDPAPKRSERRGLKAYDQYMDSIQGGLYSNEDSAMMIIQSLIKPKINGIGMKQVVEPLLPDDVLVIMDDRKYLRIMRECYTEDEIKENRRLVKQAAFEDTDDVVDTVFDSLGIDMELSSEQVENILTDVPYVLAIRDPSLLEALHMNEHVSKHN